MFQRTIHPEDLARLKAEREEADARYNAALTALDRALPPVPDPPHPPPAPDEHQITPLNERWQIVDGAGGGPLKRLLRRMVWSVVGPAFERQQAFNASLVDHVNRNLPVEKATRTSIEATIGFVLNELRTLHAFHSALIVYLQQLTPYIDTKDREFNGLAIRRDEDAREILLRLDHLEHRTLALNGAIAGLTDELLKRWESMVARERRYDAKVASVTEAQMASAQEFRDAIAVLHQSTLTLKRELERMTREGVPAASAAPAAAAAETSASTGAPAAAAGVTHSRLDAWKYVGFEDRFRGSQEEIRARLEAYLPLFEGAADVLDVGCGRGEFLELLRERGIGGRGLDINHEMVEVCRSRGLDAIEGDAVGYLRSLPDGSLGGLIAAQVVEHLEPDYLLQFLEEAYHKLRPGSAIVLETINPACWFAFFSSYIRDITHVRPLHPDTLSYLLTANGFQQVAVRYSAPYPEDQKLRRVPGEGVIADAVNANVDKLNALMFTHLDYAAIGKKL
ncbi:MAG TPA: methyltransferase domain-containing protein [Vicinamibacterales bacterium]